MESQDALVVFEGAKIRRVWHEDQWYFSVVDVVRVLTDSSDPKDYWYRMKKREAESTGIKLSTFCRQLKLSSSDGKKYETDCSNTESMFRIIQSIPSPKAEPFKQWLAKVGYERVQEIEDPELAQKRMKGLKNENLRDHMDDIELILTMLGEATTTRFTRDRDSRKFPELRKDAKLKEWNIRIRRS